ncbi:MAG: polyprenol monophosphomannose synthase [Candidatus Latescibacterota bacterium]|jgi:dolichol-phosphate mannosyltransferase
MQEEKLKVSLITPTYNESENVPILAEEIFAIVDAEPNIDLELIVVDDNSPDGTGQIAEDLKSQYPLQVIHRAGKLGLGSAVMEGFARSKRDYLGVIDADLSHDPAILPQLIRGLKQYDIAIGSRFGATSKVEKWALHRRLTSLTGVGLARLLTGVEDPLSGYFFLHRRGLGDLELTSAGYKILLEILVKGNVDSHLSIPFIFRNRQFSTSKLNLKEYMLFAKQLLYFSAYKLVRGSKKQ